MAVIRCWCFFLVVARMESRRVYASARICDDNGPNNVCIRIDKNGLTHIIIWSVFYTFFVFLFLRSSIIFFLLRRVFSFVLIFIVCVCAYYCIFTCWPRLKWAQAPEKNHRSNNLMKSKNKTISHIFWAYARARTHTLTEWLTHGKQEHSPSLPYTEP